MEGWRRNLYIMWFVQFAGIQSLTFVLAFMPLYVVELGITEVQKQGLWAGILMGISALFATFFSPFWGSLADKKGRKMMVERVLFSGAIITALMSLTTTVWQFFWLRIFQGIFGGIVSASVSLVASFTPDEKSGWALGLMQNALIIGSTVSPLLGGFLVDIVGFRMTFIVMSLLSITAGVLVHFFIKEDFTPKPSLNKKSFLSDVRFLLAIPGLFALGIISFVIQFSNLVILPMLPSMLTAFNPDINYIATLTGITVAVSGLFSGLAAIFAGILCDKYGQKKILIYMATASIIIFLLHPFAKSIVDLILLRILAGIFTGGMLPAANSLINTILPKEKNATGFGLTASFLLLGNVLGPLLGGVLPYYVGFIGVFFLTASFFALSLLLVLSTTYKKSPLEPNY